MLHAFGPDALEQLSELFAAYTRYTTFAQCGRERGEQPVGRRASALGIGPEGELASVEQVKEPAVCVVQRANLLVPKRRGTERPTHKVPIDLHLVQQEVQPASAAALLEHLATQRS